MGRLSPRALQRQRRGGPSAAASAYSIGTAGARREGVLRPWSVRIRGKLVSGIDECDADGIRAGPDPLHPVRGEGAKSIVNPQFEFFRQAAQFIAAQFRAGRRNIANEHAKIRTSFVEHAMPLTQASRSRGASFVVQHETILPCRRIHVRIRRSSLRFIPSSICENGLIDSRRPLGTKSGDRRHRGEIGARRTAYLILIAPKS